MKKVKVEIGNLIFRISAYCYKRVGDTENMKFKVKCMFHPEYNREFDDVESVKKYFSTIIEEHLYDFIEEM